MDTIFEIAQLRNRVAQLEGQLTFLFTHLQITYVPDADVYGYSWCFIEHCKCSYGRLEQKNLIRCAVFLHDALLVCMNC